MAWIISSKMKQEYLDLIKKIHHGFKPQLKHDFKTIDQKLNKTYQKVLTKLKIRPNNPSDAPTPEELQAVQRLWIKYRFQNAALFASLNPATTVEFWQNWLTEIREQQLHAIF